MLKILREKMLTLGRGEEGVAMVVTLGIFMFLYVTCASVYAVGMAVKEKMLLQAACDAAAYSAAVVQADTFSRIATINRTMGWTYAQMTKRQADYIMWKWLDGVRRHYSESVAEAKSNGSPGRHGHVHWYAGDTPAPGGGVGISAGLGDHDRVNLNNGTIARVRRGPGSIVAHQAALLNSHLRQTHSSFYESNLPGPGNVERLRRQLSKDRRNIVRMNNSLSVLLQNLPSRIRSTVTGTLHANVPEYMRNQCSVFVKDSDDPEHDYMSSMTDEDTLVSGWGGAGLGSAGNLSWLPKSEGVICRNYAQNQGGSLVAKWHWASYAWACPELGVCTATRVLNKSRRYTGRNAQGEDSTLDGLTHSYFIGVAAQPLMIDQQYFGSKGTITVALARRSANPFAAILGAQPRGIYSAFNPLASAWTFCLASAKAGYKLNDGQQDWEIRYNGKAVDFREKRDYCIDWKPTRRLRSGWYWEKRKDGTRVKRWLYDSDGWRQGWNLIQSDWDAVMVPVRQGGAYAREIRHFRSAREWRANIAKYPFNFEPYWDNDNRNQSFVAQVVNGSGWTSLDGTSVSAPTVNLSAGSPNGDAGDQLNGQLAGDLWENWWRNGGALPTATGTSQWSIGRPGQNLNWNQIGNEMYH